MIEKEKLTALLKEREPELTAMRKKTLASLHEFYYRLPTITSTNMAMIEFKAHNDELIDYVLQLESLLNELFRWIGMEAKK